MVNLLIPNNCNVNFVASQPLNNRQFRNVIHRTESLNNFTQVYMCEVYSFLEFDKDTNV